MVRVLDLACRRGQFATLVAAVRPRHMSVSSNNLRGVEKILEIPSFDKKISGVQLKIFVSLLLHSAGIQLLPVDFWLHPHQWCQAAGAPLRHFRQ